MGYIKEEQILLDETLCSESSSEADKLIYIATKRFKENIKLVNYIGRKYNYLSNPAYDSDDILQQGYLGLWLACLNFNPNLGYEFSTYAFPLIRGHILKFLRDNNVAINIPRWMNDLRYTLYRHGFELPLSKYEIDTILAEGVFTYDQLIIYTGVSVTSIDIPIELKDGDASLHDIIKDYTPDVQDTYTEDELEGIISDILKMLPKRHRDLVEEWMYSIIADDKLTQRELSKKYEISQVHVNRILSKAKSILRENNYNIYKLFGF